MWKKKKTIIVYKYWNNSDMWYVIQSEWQTKWQSCKRQLDKSVRKTISRLSFLDSFEIETKNKAKPEMNIAYTSTLHT